MSPIVLGFALLALVLTVSALLSGVVERAPLSFPMLFLGLGLLAGERGLGLLPLDAHHPALESIATLSLALVLFLDAVTMQVDELRQDWRGPLLALGPGTLLTIAGVAGAAALLLGTPPVHAVLLGAILSSTDPVVLRGVLRNDQIPRSVRRPTLHPSDRLFWSWLSFPWPGWQHALAFVQLHTVMAWQKQRFRDGWRHRSQGGTPGRPTLAIEGRDLLHDLWRANPLWGSPRLVGELRQLGSNVATSTVEP